MSLGLLGGLCWLTWSAGMRGFMAEVAGEESSVDWSGTFGWILLPGIGVGARVGRVLPHDRWTPGVAIARPRTASSSRHLLGIVLSSPQDLLWIFEEGVGGGAIGGSLYGLAGVYPCREEGRFGPCRLRSIGPDGHTGEGR